MIRFFASHATAANLLMAGFLLVGMLALPGLQRASMPDFTATTVEVRVPYPGATAADVEAAICRRVEEAVESLEDVSEVRSEARDGYGSITLEMREGGDPVTFLTDIKTDVEAITNFPDRAESPTVRPLLRTDRVVSVAVTGDMSVSALKAYCEHLKDRLQRLPQAPLVTLKGFGQRQYRIEAPAAILMQHGISADELTRIIGAQNLDMPSGALHTVAQDVVIRFTDERRTPAQLRNVTILSSEDGGEVRLGDIAEVSDVFEPPETRILFNGKRAGVLAIEKTKRADALRVFEAVRNFVEAERHVHPSGIALHLTEDASSLVRDRLALLVKNGWQGLLLVFLVMWLFFGFRYSFWVAMGVPVAFMGAIFAMPLFGMTLNMLTMVGLLMALGLIMDDAIVIAENIAHEREQGKNALDATVAGVQGVAPGVLSSFLTTLSVFAPLAYLSGNIGAVLRVVPIVLIITLLVSLVEAFLILPNHLSHSLARQGNASLGAFRRRFDAGFAWVRERVVGRFADVAIRWRYVTVGAAIALLLLSLGIVASGRVKFQAFPELDGDVAYCRVLLPAGTPLHKTKAVIDRLEKGLQEVNDEYQQQRPGAPALVKNVKVTFNENSDAKEQGAHVATMSVDLLAAEKRDARVDPLLNRWRERVGTVPDAVSLQFTQGAFGPAGRAIDVRLQSEDLALLESAGHEAKTWFAQFEGVQDLMVDLRPGKPEMVVRMRAGARSMGLTAKDVASQLRAAFHGATASEVQVGREDFEIDVRLSKRDRDSLADLDYFHVTLQSGQQVPLSAVTEVVPSRGYARIGRVNRRRTATVTGSIDTQVANTNEILTRFRSDLQPQLEAQGVAISFSGEAQEGATTQASMMRALLIGLIGIFVLLSFQFRSYVEPLVIMAAIPLAMIGVVWGHKLLGLPLTMPSLLGFASLAGIVVNDSILLVVFIHRRHTLGAAPEDAARLASRARFRAVLITSLTTIVGLLPLLAETSLQAQVLIPLAASIVFGLAASTLLVLFFVPSLWAILADFGFIRHRRTVGE